MSTLANALPENTGDGYVAAAYIAFFVLLLVYVAIMALRLGHMQRDLRDLQAHTRESAREEKTRRGMGAETGTGAETGPAGRRRRQGDETREREPA
jgi:hypothetical protein